jgi:outer membrane protein assembly factor BamD (BamD/ComL family)
MKVTIRWLVWAVAIGSGAVLGIAVAGGEGPTEGKSLEEWIHLLSDPDWTVRAQATEALRGGGEDAYKALFAVENPDLEARFRIALLKKEMAPLYGSWKDALTAGRTAFDGGDMKPALRYFLVAARKKDVLRDDPWLADLCSRAWQALPEDERGVEGRPDWELLLCGEHDRLADRFPESPRREKALFLAGRYGEVIKAYPEGTYAPLAKYSLTAGHAYFEPPRYLEIKDPEKEVEAWPRFLTEHPGHPGSDDAAYRLGRALEKLTRYREAALWLARSASLPDGEFRWKGPLRALYVLDALASEEELEALAGSNAPPEIGERAFLTLGIRSLRTGKYVEALSRFERFLIEYPKSAHRVEVEKRCGALREILIPRASEIESPVKADTALYALGRYFYHDLLALYNPAWAGNRVNYFSYEVNCLGRSHAFTHPEYFESHNNYLCAAGYFDRLWKEHGRSPLRAKALYSAGTCYFKAPTLNQFSVFRRTPDELLAESLARYKRLLKEHPDHPLARDAKKMIEVVKNTPKTTWR